MDRMLLRPDEAAVVIGVGRAKLYALIAAGELPAIRVGSSLRVPVDDLRQWVRAQIERGRA